MIFPSLLKLTKRSKFLRGGGRFISIIKFPLKMLNDDSNRRVVDQLRNQPMCNDIIKYTESPFSDDLEQMIEFKGSFCKPDPINSILRSITRVHNSLNSKKTPEIKNWLRILTGIHPEIDRKIKKLGYWKMQHSENIGTNTITYNPDYSSVDVLKWGKITPCINNDPHIKSNGKISYIRDSMRQKLDSPVVEFIQNANHIGTAFLLRNLTSERYMSTDSRNGGSEIVIKGTIAKETAHGCSLNADVHHNERMESIRMQCINDAISYLRRDGTDSYKLVNHITPLTNKDISHGIGAILKDPLNIEYNIPIKGSPKKYEIDQSGQRVLKSPTDINNDVLKPEKIDE